MLRPLNDRSAQMARRWRQVGTLVRTSGVRGLVARALAGWSRRLEPPAVAPGVRDVDVLAADLERPVAPEVPRISVDEPMAVNWVMTAPHAGSGGHTTAFRLIRHLQAQGHRCRVYLYEVFGGDFTYFKSIVHRSYADSATEVGNVLDGMADANAIFATSWETAYVVYNSSARGKRFYLVQDFEPYFYPFGGTSTLAENTYRMGFHAITAGRWLAELLRREYHMPADAFDFGCDTDVYRLGSSQRDGVVFYARPQAPRRAFELGSMSLEIFAGLQPDIEIHMYGDRVGKRRFPYRDHGLVAPSELNLLYNRCFAGLTLSMTNVSLVPHEMLAAGCIPVVNDAEHNRIVLDNQYVSYVAPTPHAIARRLASIVETPDFSRLAREASLSVAGISWDLAGELVESVLTRELTR